MEKDYINFIINKVQGKRVLDIGSIGHSFVNRKRYRYWLFEIIHDHAASVVGIDYLKEEVELARKEGYDIRFGDAHDFHLNEKFDLIIANDLIEHLSSPGLFINCCREHLLPLGELIITTPNIFSLAHIYKVITSLTNDPPENPEHTVYFTPSSLNELFNRYNFLSTDTYYFASNLNSEKKLESTLQKINSKLCNLFAKRFHQEMAKVYKQK